MSKTGDREILKGLEVLQHYKTHLEGGNNARTIAVEEKDKEHVADLDLLTAKPVMYACNVSEADAVSGNDFTRQIEAIAKAEGSELLIISAKIESEIVLLAADEQQMFLEDLGLHESGMDRMIRGAYHLLGLQTYFTAGEKEVRAWTIQKNTKAPQAAAVIHTDFEKGFIRAEVMAYDDFVGLGSESACRDAGKLRVEGKEYIVQDGDLMHFRFNV